MPIDPNLLKDLRKRREAALLGGGEDKMRARKEKGLLSARERLLRLFDPDTFQEFGMHAQHACKSFGMDRRKMPGDGVVTGTGYVEGRPVAAYAHDFTVGGGALGRIHAKKVCDLIDFAIKAGIPVVGVNDSGGARIQEGVDSLSGYGEIFYRNVQCSGLVPQIAIIAGPCAGGAAYSPALTDFLIMTRKNANMFICGPQVIQAATGEKAELAQFASADAHASVSGNIHLIAEDDAHAIELTQTLLSYLPANNIDDAPHHLSESLSLDARIVPADPKLPFDAKEVIEALADKDSFFEIMPDFAKNMVTGFARIDGAVVGIVANQPTVKAGYIYSIPLVTLVDVPGFLPGLAQERGGIIRHGAKMLFAYASATVPKITVIMRKAYGGAYLAMCSADLGADLVFAWPTAEIAVMGAEGAVNIVFGKELKESADPDARRKELIEAYRDEFASPYQAAANAFITDVIEPSQTRACVSLGLRSLLSKRETRPPKKHGNIPL